MAALELETDACIRANRVYQKAKECVRQKTNELMYRPDGSKRYTLTEIFFDVTVDIYSIDAISAIDEYIREEKRHGIKMTRALRGNHYEYKFFHIEDWELPYLLWIITRHQVRTTFFVCPRSANVFTTASEYYEGMSLEPIII